MPTSRKLRQKFADDDAIGHTISMALVAAGPDVSLGSIPLSYKATRRLTHLASIHSHAPSRSAVGRRLCS